MTHPTKSNLKPATAITKKPLRTFKHKKPAPPPNLDRATAYAYLSKLLYLQDKAYPTINDDSYVVRYDFDQEPLTHTQIQSLIKFLNKHYIDCDRFPDPTGIVFTGLKSTDEILEAFNQYVPDTMSLTREAASALIQKMLKSSCGNDSQAQVHRFYCVGSSAYKMPIKEAVRLAHFFKEHGMEGKVSLSSARQNGGDHSLNIYHEGDRAYIVDKINEIFMVKLQNPEAPKVRGRLFK